MPTDLVHDVLLNNHIFHCRPFDLIYRNYNNTGLEYDQLVYCDTHPNMYRVLAMRRGVIWNGTYSMWNFTAPDPYFGNNSAPRVSLGGLDWFLEVLVISFLV
jgi:hypothetical protein